jgi:hypothetical protein
LVGSLFVLFLYQIYKNRKGGLGSGSSGSSSTKKPTGTGGKDQKQGGWFQGGQGGMNDLFGYGKSNAQVYGEEKKIKTRFKDVAGLESAK